VHDHVGGLDDILAKRVRFIGDPDQRIAEDYLRILRFFRIHAAHGAGEPDRNGYLACIRARAGLATLSAERVRMEMLKLVIAEGAAGAVAAMADGGLLLPIFGGIGYTGPFAAMITAERLLGLKPVASARSRSPSPRTPGGLQRACGSPMPKPRRSIPWGIAGGGSAAWTRRSPGDGSIGSARTATATG
jgi:hypothetical protein